MPRTKRSKVVSLTKTKKKTSTAKELLVKRIKQCLKKYERSIIFSHEHMTTVPFRQIQQACKDDSKFFLGKNKVMKTALGKDEETSISKNSYLLGQKLKGESGLLFTNKTLQQIQSQFEALDVKEFSRVGDLATQTIVLQKGPQTFKSLGFSIEPYLRKLGLNTQLINQEIILNENFILCQEGKELSVEQCKILVISFLLIENYFQRVLDIKLAKFTLTPICVMEKNGSFRLLKK